MDLFKAQFDRISRQLSGLTPSQKMLTGTLVAIMVMTLIMWGKYAAEPETVALFSQPPSADELMTAENALNSAGIKATESGGNLMVPTDERARAYAMLSLNNALPRASKDTFEEIAKSISPLASESTAKEIYNHASEVIAGQMIEQFGDVALASVRIESKEEFHFGASTQPRAVATISTRDHKVPPTLVKAVADLLESSVSDLPRSNIKVIVNGRSFAIPGEQDGDSSAEGQIDQIKLADKQFTENAQRALSSAVPGALVTVTVQINTSRVEERANKVDPKGTISKEKQITSSSTETTGPTPAPPEAGVVPNTGFTNAAPPAATGASTTHEQNSTTFENFVSTTQTDTHTPGGTPKPVSAAVSVPLAYYTKMYSIDHPGTNGQPTTIAMQSVIDRENKKIKEIIKGATGMTEDSAIYVAMSTESSEEAPPVLVSTTGVSSLRLFTPHRIKEGILGVMALASLFMVSSLVKKGATAAVAQGATGIANTETPTASSTLLGSGEVLVGEVAGGDASLDAVELDEEAIRAQQVVEQVSKLVKENPDSAAAMVKRWMNRT